ncbi:MAG TPA: phage tail tip lysozyme [Candidatus Saccharimonadales bacterium]|nr:phage tail tip lysozyme [Candidatus Saccharimonadales bacterium]
MRKFVPSISFERIGVVLTLILFCFSQSTAVVSAISTEQKSVYDRSSLYYDVGSCAPEESGSDGGATPSTTGETTGPPKAVQKVVWNVLTSGGIDEIHTAAIMGSIDNEGAWHPMNVGYFPNNFDGKDPSVPKAVNEGYGLIGWTPGTNLLEDMKKLGLKDEKPYTAETQAKVIVGYLQKENKTGRYSNSDVRAFLNAKTLSAASKAWIGGPGYGFERPADNGPSAQQERLQSAKEMLRKFKGSTGVAPATTATGGGGGVCCSSSGGGSASSGPVVLTGKTNAEKIFNYLIDYADLTDKQAAGAVGAMMLESGGNTLNIDPTAENPSSHAYGIAQWLGSRKTGLINFANKQEGDKSDLVIQVQYLKQEMESNINGYVNNDFKKQRSLSDAVKYWTDNFEGLSGDASQQLYSDRITNARILLNSVNGGDASTGDSISSTPATASGSCSCPSPSASGKTVVIDPGHGPTKTTVDSATGLTMQESDNQPEGHDVWQVANKIKDDLSKDGYNIILTKKTEDDNVTFRQRAQVADNNNAALALSIHGDSTLPDPGEIFVQKVGLYRGSGSNKTVFKDDEVAKKSQQYAQVFKEERQKAEGGNIVIKDNSFNGRAGLEPGNIPMVQLFSKTPWVYNEKKMPFNNDKYAEGLENGIKKALGSGGADEPSAGGCTDGAVPGDLLKTVKNYAWPNYSETKSDPVPAYKSAIDKAQNQGQYVGQIYTDCGGFVTRAMIDSGFEPNYNYGGKLSDGAGNTVNQEQWLKANWQKISVSDTNDLQPGDVAISNTVADHTYMYVGHIDGFNGAFASASQGSRAPMASSAWLLTSFDWYRKK